MLYLEMTIGVLAVLLGTIAPALADVPTGFSVDLSDTEAVVGLVLGGLAFLWVVRKMIKSINRS